MTSASEIEYSKAETNGMESSNAAGNPLAAALAALDTLATMMHAGTRSEAGRTKAGALDAASDLEVLRGERFDDAR